MVAKFEAVVMRKGDGIDSLVFEAAIGTWEVRSLKTFAWEARAVLMQREKRPR